MADRPVLFSSPMIRALIDGRKTQTRRVVRVDKIKPSIWTHDSIGAFRFLDRIGYWQARAGDFNVWSEAVPHIHRVGDRLWCREAWRAAALHDARPPREIPEHSFVTYEAGSNDFNMAGRLRASMHMPRWASRLTLIVTDVRVQRLHEISEEDAIAEGVTLDGAVAGVDVDIDGEWWPGGPKRQYARLWNSINGPGAWESNPWVAAYTFTVHKTNIDALALANAEPSP